MCPTSTTIRNFDISHLTGACGGLGFAIFRAIAAWPSPAGASDHSKIDATSVETRLARMLRGCPKCYSAAAVRGRPTKPVTSPKRSSITAERSLVLLVTQAPERTA
ncbi:hypothetical protein ACVWWO_004997 [Bradyrhizobium sp. F1.13.1]